MLYFSLIFYLIGLFPIYIFQMRKLDTQLRYYLHIDPDSLTDWEWAMRVNELKWIRKQEAEAARQK